MQDAWAEITSSDPGGLCDGGASVRLSEGASHRDGRLSGRLLSLLPVTRSPNADGSRRRGSQSARVGVPHAAHSLLSAHVVWTARRAPEHTHAGASDASGNLTGAEPAA